MTTKKTSELPAATIVNDDDLIAIVQAGVDKKASRALVEQGGLKMYRARIT